MRIDESIGYHNSQVGVRKLISRKDLFSVAFPDQKPEYAKSAFSRWSHELYVPKPTPKQIKAISLRLNVSEDYLMRRNGNPKRETN